MVEGYWVSDKASDSNSVSVDAWNEQLAITNASICDLIIPEVLHLRQLDGRWGLPWL